MKTYKFEQLSTKSKVKACRDYLKGWNKTHPNDNIPMDELMDILENDLDDYLYDVDGNLIEV